MILHPSLLHSEQKGIRVLILGNDENKVNTFEARSENDPDLLRIDVLSVRTLVEAEKIIKKSEPLLVVFQDGFDGKDAISIQLQLRHIDKKLQFVPVLKTLDLPTISQLQRIGNIHDYAETPLLDNYDSLKSVIIEFVRKYSSKDGVLSELLSSVGSIQQALLVGFQSSAAAKKFSVECVRALIPHYDLSTIESASVVAADRIYFPDITPAQYKSILANNVPDVLDVLNATGSWKDPERAPQSVPGFIVTASNYMAEAFVKSHSLAKVESDIEGKALHLKHPAARVLNAKVLAQVVTSLLAKEKKAA